MDKFIGRKYELERLNLLLEQRSASMVVVNGRRRIGKSRLITQFAKAFKFYKFSGLAPRKGMTAQEQRNEFMRQFANQFDLPIAGIIDWGQLFTLLAKQTLSGRVVILLDEISWMAIGDPDFLGKLKIVWDETFRKNSKLILFLCGSVSSWIEENLLSSTAFLGRPTLHISLGELPLYDCNYFWDAQTENISAYEKLKLLAVTGGVPRYLELFNPSLTSEQNIQQLFFTKESTLSDEFTKIFADIYGNRSQLYRSIVEQLINAPMTQEALSIALQKAHGGDMSRYLEDLTLGGFVTRDYTWDIKTGKISNLSHYRLSDNYLRFSLKYILPNKALISKGRFEHRSIKSLPGWDGIMGLQFENLVLANHRRLIKQLNLLEEDIIFDNPYFQRKTKRIPACQIDYLIQTRHESVYVCEIKFHRKEIGSGIINEVKEKLSRLKVPKHISKRPVLIHVNGVTEYVRDSLYFSKIIDFGDLLDS